MNNKNRKLIIWGAGKTGRLAFEQYKNSYNIICYVDSNPQKWNCLINGIPICDPEIIAMEEADIVIALRSNVQDIIERIESSGKALNIILFDVTERIISSKMKTIDTFNDCLFLSFSGGLGNQLFQYAVYRSFELNGKTIYANIDKYLKDEKRIFVLPTVFSELSFKYATGEDENDYRKAKLANNRSRKYIDYIEDYSVGGSKKAPCFLLDINAGIIKGTHQTCFFANRIRGQLLETLVFDYKREEKLISIVEKERSCHSVSIHFRRGDYLNEITESSYCGICTEEYYERAIKYIESRIEAPTFFVFSDDIEFIKHNYTIPNAVYIEKNMFTYYEDWYDMCLMSNCKNNIIANSTFSWWGAWLNQNEDKIVVAPKKWVNTFEYEDIYPDEWITI